MEGLQLEINSKFCGDSSLFAVFPNVKLQLAEQNVVVFDIMIILI